MPTVSHWTASVSGGPVTLAIGHARTNDVKRAQRPTVWTTCLVMAAFGAGAAGRVLIRTAGAEAWATFAGMLDDRYWRH